MLWPVLDAAANVEITKVSVPVLLLHGSDAGHAANAALQAFLTAARDARRSLQTGEIEGVGAQNEDARALGPRVVAAIIAWLAETR